MANSNLMAERDGILTRMIFDGEQPTDLPGSRELGWEARRDAELALMAAHSDKLDALKTHKKGLLQQLYHPLCVHGQAEARG